MAMRVPRPLFPLATAAALLGPAAAEAASIDPLAPCFRSVDASTRELVPVRAEGFTPGAEVSVAIDGEEVETGQAYINGEVVGSVAAPYQRRGQRRFTLTVTEKARQTNTASTSSRVAALGMRLKPRKARPSRRVKFIGLGFTDDTEVFAHYVRGGRLRRTVSLGEARGPCGRVRVKRRQIPVRRPATGRWTLQVDNEPLYTPTPAGVFVRLMITVRKVLAAQATAASSSV